MTRADLAEQRRQQEAIVAWLLAREPGSERIDTHASTLVLAGERAFKLKRALDVGWMDFSTLAKREAACRRELELNARTAPGLYLDVQPVVKAGEAFALGGAGAPLEWLVVMRRFEEENRFDRLLAAGRLTPRLVDRLADGIAAFHADAEVRADAGGYAGLARVARENARDLAAASGAVPAATARALEEATRAALEAGQPLLELRREAGWVRRCHGDLHLANIALWREEPTLFDCIEFNEAIGTVDVLYDLAFLLMDFDRHGRRDLANRVFNRWLVEPAHLPALSLLPLMLSLRAAVRAKVAALGLEAVATEKRPALAAEARDYAERALAYLAPPPPCLVAVGGLSGSGKSTLAAALAPLLGAAPGALLVRSDVLRKRLFGVKPEERLPAEAYAPAWHERVAAAMMDEAAAALAAGHSAVLDAVHGQPRSQAAIAALAESQQVPFAGFWLSAPEAVLVARVEARRGDASDATAEVVRRQLAGGEPETDWHRLDATGDMAAILQAARAVLRR